VERHVRQQKRKNACEAGKYLAPLVFAVEENEENPVSCLRGIGRNEELPPE